jgi:hypothetical protein
LEVPKHLDNPTNERVRDRIIDMGYDLNPMKGVKGEFYTTDRFGDLASLAKEIIAEREAIGR